MVAIPLLTDAELAGLIADLKREAADPARDDMLARALAERSLRERGGPGKVQSDASGMTDEAFVAWFVEQEIADTMPLAFYGNPRPLYGRLIRIGVMSEPEPDTPVGRELFDHAQAAARAWLLTGGRSP